MKKEINKILTHKLPISQQPKQHTKDCRIRQFDLINRCKPFCTKETCICAESNCTFNCTCKTDKDKCNKCA